MEASAACCWAAPTAIEGSPRATRDSASARVRSCATAVCEANRRDNALPTASAEKKRVRTRARTRSEEHTSELQSLMRISYAVFCLQKKNKQTRGSPRHNHEQ